MRTHVCHAAGSATFRTERKLLRLPLLNGAEYATAMTRQFHDVSELLSEHSLRQAVGKLAGTETQLLDKDGKKQMCRYIESDANQRILERLRNDIRKII